MYELTTERITAEHKEKIESLRFQYNHTLSSHAFASLYLWQRQMELSLYIGEQFYTAKYGIKGKNAWFFPCGDEKRIYEFIDRAAREKNLSLHYLRECDVRWLEQEFPDRWKIYRAEDADEYICDICEYIEMKGGKFSEIRRKKRKIDEAYQVKSAQLCESNISDAAKVIGKWHEAAHTKSGEGVEDDTVSEQALAERELLELDGSILYIDGEPISFFAGFPLSSDTVDIVCGKNTPDAPRGTVYYALLEYLKMCADKYVYCNHEEDLGIPGIRYIKKSLCPIRKNEIWEAVLL